jgi:hypothetical protein
MKGDIVATHSGQSSEILAACQPSYDPVLIGYISIATSLTSPRTCMLTATINPPNSG